MKIYTKQFQSATQAQCEYAGHKFIANYYSSVPTMQTIESLSTSLIYEDITAHGARTVTDVINHGIPVDLSHTFTELAKIANIHAHRRFSEGGTIMFFVDRLERLDRLLDLKYDQWVAKNHDTTVNGLTVNTNQQLLTDVSQLIAKFRYGLCIPSQGDIHERNIFNCGTIIDFEGAGWNLLATDLATFIWHTLVAGNYFGPLYAKWASDDDKHLFYSQRQQIICHNNGKIEILLNAPRAELLKQFMEHFAGKIDQIDNTIWHQTAVAIVFRLLTTYSVNNMSPSDQHIIFALSNYFFTNQYDDLPSKISQLLKV